MRLRSCLVLSETKETYVDIPQQSYISQNEINMSIKTLRIVYETHPRKEGSVRASGYPTIPVENTSSPLTGDSAPKEYP